MKKSQQHGSPQEKQEQLDIARQDAVGSGGEPGPVAGSCRSGETVGAIRAIVIFGAAFWIAGCANSGGTSDQKVEQNIAASCRAWEDRAKKAAHPDAEMIASHDRLMAKAAMFGAEAQAKYNDAAARRAAIENEVQAELDAAAVYDWRHALEVASHCWEGLALTEEIHHEQRQRLAQMAEQLATQQPAPTFTPDPSIYTIHTQPPAPPSPTPIPNVGQTYVPSTSQTWGNSPYGPMVPPVMRDEPVQNVNPAIPPVAR
ncbi:MAG: hypothetical protein WA441_13400 [Methyloceanibacter sp.]